MGNKKLYTVYLPKKKGATTNNVVKWIELYSKLTASKNSIIVSPGYMSTTSGSISDFLSQMSTTLGLSAAKPKVVYGILNGMNGSRKLASSSTTLIAAHKGSITNDLPQKDCFENIDFDVNDDPDHRKVMVFFTEDGSFKRTTIDKTNYNDFLKTVTVNAVLLGSSNQSRTTYFASSAPKGEADIFMMCVEEPGNKSTRNLLRSIAADNDQDYPFDDELGEYNELIENVTVSEAFDGKNSNDPHAFLKDILEDLLETGLS